MAKNNFYAYKLPSGEEGILSAWDETDKKVKGVYGARYRGFKTRPEAITWLKMGADYTIKRVKKMKPGIYFDAGTGRGDGVEISVTDEKGKDLLHKVIHIKNINKHGKHLVGKEFTNNYGELLAMKNALKLAIKEGVKTIYGDSKLVIDYWSKGFMKAKDLPRETLELIEEVRDLRETFEMLDGKVKRVSGDDNPADLGFH